MSLGKFKDLPDTSTPINSSRLNGLLDGAEAMGNIVVDSIKSKNMFNKDTLITGYLYDNGSIYNNTAWVVSDYIPIEPNTAYTSSGFTNGSGNNPARCYYTKNKTYISGVVHNSNNPFIDTAPANAYYMRESVRKDDIDTLQVEKGTSATNYTSFQNLDNTSYVLYDNITGTNDDVTLSDNINNYKYIEIFYKRTGSTSQNNEGYDSTKFVVKKFEDTNAYSISLSSTYSGATQTVYSNAIYSINPNTNNVLTLSNHSRLSYNYSTSDFTMDTTTKPIYITRVVGYK